MEFDNPLSNLENIVSKEDKNISEKVSGFFSSVIDHYFRPKSLEKKAYEKLGIKQFKKFYSYTLGKLVSYMAEDKDRWINDFSSESIKRYDEFTRICEGAHLIGNLIFLPIIIDMAADGNYKHAVQVAAANTLVNLYPIMLQRYNRARTYSLLEHKKARI